MFRKYLVYIVIAIVSLGRLHSQEEIYTIQKCVEIAIANNPQIQIAQSNYEYSEASAMGAAAPLYPQIAFQSSWLKNGGTFLLGPISRPGDYENYMLGFQAQQLIFDFGKSYSRVSAASDFSESAKQGIAVARQNIIVATESAYYNCLQSLRLKTVSEEVLKQAEEHLHLAQAFYDVGKNSMYAVMKASTDVANAKVSLISAQNGARLSRIQLENTMNFRLKASDSLQDNLDIRSDSLDLMQCIDSALNHRPEINSGKLVIEANKSMLNSAWNANLPTINASGSYLWRSLSLDQPFYNSWSIGLNFSLPIFQGFNLQAGIDQARANLKSSEANYTAIAQSVIFDVELQFSSLTEAKERIDATRYLVSQAEETLKLANGRYNEGVGSPVEITDARVTLYNARTSYIQSLYNYQLAYSRLLRAMGSSRY